MKQLFKKRIMGGTICLTLLASGSAAALSTQPGVSSPGSSQTPDSTSQPANTDSPGQAPTNTSNNLPVTQNAVPLAPVSSTGSINLLIAIILVTFVGGSVWAVVRLRKTARVRH